MPCHTAQVLAWLQLKAAQVKDAVQGLLAGMEEEAQLAYVISFLVSPAAKQSNFVLHFLYALNPKAPPAPVHCGQPCSPSGILNNPGECSSTQKPCRTL